MIPDFWLGVMAGACVGILACNASWSQECKEMNEGWSRVAKGILARNRKEAKEGSDKGGWDG